MRSVALRESEIDHAACMCSGVSMTRHLIYELACIVGADSMLLGTVHDPPHALAEDVLVQSRCDNSLDAIVHAGYLQGTHPVRSEIPGRMSAQSRSLPFGRESV